MTIWYIDALQGNDANAGTSYATRKQTPDGISTYAAGDEVRFVETRAPVSVGNVTWTDNSDVLTLSTPLNYLEIDPSTAAWTPSANVTTLAESSSLHRRQSPTASRINIATGFTTGKVAYRTLPATVDASAFEALTFMVKILTASTTNWQNLNFNLCSDATGDVPVLTVNFGTLLADQGPGQSSSFTLTTVSFITMVFDNVAALPSNINSLSISATADPVVPNFTLSNILAVKGRASADHFTYDTLFSKQTEGEPEWYPLGYVDSATQVRLIDAASGVPGPTGKINYRGTTETVETFMVAPEFHYPVSGQRSLPTTEGTFAAPITVTFGWTRASSMESQTGKTFVCGGKFATSYLTTYGQTQISGDAVFSGFRGIPLALAGIPEYWEANVTSYVDTNNTVSSDLLSNESNCVGNFTIDSLMWANTVWVCGNSWATKLNIRRISGYNTNGITAGMVTLATGQIGRASQTVDIRIGQIDNSRSGGVALSSQAEQYLKGTLFKWNEYSLTTSSQYPVTLDNCTFQDPSLFSTAFTGSTITGVVKLSKVGGDVTNNQIYTGFWQALTQSAVTSTGTGKAWECTIRSDEGQGQNRFVPAAISLAKVASNAGSFTVTVACRRSSSTITAGIRVLGGIVTGVSDAQDTVGAVGSWEDVTLTITPTEAGVVEVEGFFWGTLNDVCYFDDVRVS